MNNDCKDNRLKNLELTTQSEADKQTDHSQSKKTKPVKAINVTTKKITYHKSMNSAAAKFNVNVSSIKYICEKSPNFYHAYSRDTKEKYTFEYITYDEYKKQMSDKRDKKLLNNEWLTN